MRTQSASERRAFDDRKAGCGKRAGVYGLTTLELDNNQLTGTIPAELGDLTDMLIFLRLADNGGLTGCIPLSLRNVIADSHGLPAC